jgi:cytochrome c553
VAAFGIRSAALSALGVLLTWIAAGEALANRVRAPVVQAAPSAAGSAIYLQGVLPSGAPLEAVRADAPPLTGAQAACANCHRRSGLGYKEARITIPPIAASFLFSTGIGVHVDASHPFVPGARLERKAYTPETLARAIRDGIDSEGRQLSYLMPRFALSDDDMAALIAHLRSLDLRRVPGVSETDLHFATILAPDVTAERRQMVRQVIEQYFQDRNAGLRGPGAQAMNSSGATAYARMMFKVNRNWVLHEWEPTGPPSTWTRQLEEKFSEHPVFAVISGIAGPSWPVIGSFCERKAIPCLFPNVEAPPANADEQFHSVFFSRGVLLEADLIQAALLDEKAGPASKRVVQIYRTDDVGASGAQALETSLAHAGMQVRPVPIDSPQKLAAAIASSSSADALVLWLRPLDLRALPPSPGSPGRKRIYLSGLMAGLDAAPLPPAWRSQVHMAYPVDLPESRRVRLDYARAWLRIRHIAVMDERLQADSYLACGLLSETLKHMVDAFVPDYLVESLENTVEHRLLTGYYPRLTLAPNQRFASKGGYVVHFETTQGRERVVPDGSWVTP